MTDIWILSDLHHDFEAFAWPVPPRHDLLVVAGHTRRTAARSNANWRPRMPGRPSS